MAATGWTWDYTEDTLTTSRMIALQAEYETNPPIHVMGAIIASYFGAFKPTVKSDISELVNLFPGGTIG